MSTLRKCLKYPGTYLALLGLMVALVVLDGLRPPDRQWSSHIYVAAVHLYQHGGRPLLEGRVQCRYQPTCSNYSIAVVRKYGLSKGLGLTAARLWRCRSRVPLGTSDPVP